MTMAGRRRHPTAELDRSVGLHVLLQVSWHDIVQRPLLLVSRCCVFVSGSGGRSWAIVKAAIVKALDSKETTLGSGLDEIMNEADSLFTPTEFPFRHRRRPTRFQVSWLLYINQRTFSDKPF